MQLLIRGAGIKVGEPLREHITRRLHFALGRFHPAIRRLDVRVGDVNGPRGGVDKICHILVSLRASGSSPVAVETSDSDLYAAVDRSTDRVGRSVARALERQRQRRGNRRRGTSADNGELIFERRAALEDGSLET